MNVDTIEIGKKIKELRLERKLSQEKLAKLSGVSKGHISNLELGNRKSISIERLDKIVTALGVSIDNMLAEYLTKYNNQDTDIKQRIIAEVESSSEDTRKLFNELTEKLLESKHE